MDASDLTARTDEELLTAHMDGDAGAFPELVERYRNDLLHFLIRFMGGRAAAEDVFQEAFLQVHISSESFDPSRRFKPWLFTIAANKGRDWHRKHSKRAMASLSMDVGEQGEGSRFVDLLDGDYELPDVGLLEGEQVQQVRQAVDHLPQHLREILLLSYFQRMSYLQIADSLDIPLGTVKSRLHSAVAAFARSWQETTGEAA